ncbi:MAG: hypothetical protein GQ570_10905 [Helicobacteraceae bacterium]|nr:hypothetical protein [Helicobacteraceae bacterium]
MKRMFKMVGVATLAVLMLSGCRMAQIYNVKDAPVIVKPATSDRAIFNAINRAGTSLGWDISSVKDGEARGVLNIRDHQAVVSITYNDKSYNIKYVSSINLKAENGEIKSNYNGWVQNLERNINLQISELTQ